jgi:lipid-A-disaccharide synthase
VKPLQFMLIAGEASGDALGAELITALQAQPLARDARFFGVGGPQMQSAGMELIFDFTRNSVFGLEALKRIVEFRRQFEILTRLAKKRRPDVVIGVDFGGFNSRFAEAIRKAGQQTSDWRPKLVQFVSPQVWASRPWRAKKLARSLDLLLSIFPFEKQWYASRTPNLHVEFVGHPIVDRHGKEERKIDPAQNDKTSIVFLPGSRPSELKRHLPVMREALARIQAAVPDVRPVMVLPAHLAEMARQTGLPAAFEVRPGLADELRQADLAIAKSGTVTLECAFFQVPTIAMYKTSIVTYAIAKRIVQVKWVAMPNILANEEVFPEFVQSRATPENIAHAALELLRDTARRNEVKTKLAEIGKALGQPGAARRAAGAILALFSAAEQTPGPLSKIT